MKRLIWLIALLFVVCSCRENSSVTSALDCAEEVMVVRPDSALHLLRSIDRADIRRDATLARYALRYSQALDKNSIDVTQDTLIRIAADYYMDCYRMFKEKTMSLYYLGRVYENAGDVERAVDVFTQAEALSQKVAHEDPYCRGLVCLVMGRRYSEQHGFDRALEYYKKAELAFTAAENWSNAGRCCYRQAMIHYYWMDYQTAKESMQRAVDYSNAARCEKDQCYYGEYLDFLEIFTDTTLDDRVKRSRLSELHISDSSYFAISKYSRLASLYGELNQLDSVRFYAKKVLDCAVEDRSWNAWAYDVLSRVERFDGNHRKALEYREKSIAAGLSFDSLVRVCVPRKLEQRVDAEKLQLDYTMLEMRNRYHVVIAALACLLILLLVWQIVRVTRQWRRRLLEQQEADRCSHDEAVQQLTATYEEIREQHDLLLSKVNEVPSDNDERESRFFEAIENRLQGLKSLVDSAYLYKKKPTAFFKAFSSQATVSPSAKKEVWADLQYVVNKKFGGVIDYLRENFPNLTRQELDLCCLICFGFSPAGICFVYGYADMGSMYNKRSRLRQKLGLRERQRLDRFLTALCRELRDGAPRSAKK